VLLSVAEIQQNSEMLQKVDVYTADALFKCPTQLDGKSTQCAV